MLLWKFNTSIHFQQWEKNIQQQQQQINRIHLALPLHITQCAYGPEWRYLIGIRVCVNSRQKKGEHEKNVTLLMRHLFYNICHTKIMCTI